MVYVYHTIACMLYGYIISLSNMKWQSDHQIKKNWQYQKQDILGHFAKFNAHQIFPLYGMQEIMLASFGTPKNVAQTTFTPP